VSLEVSITRDGALFSWRWLNFCLLMGSSEWIPCFALLVRMAFALPVKLPLSQEASHFLLLILSPVRGGVSERLCGA